MTSHMSLKHECIEALKACIQNCLVVIERHKSEEEMRPSVKLCELCIAACEDCIVAFESVQANRGPFMQVCVEISHACIANYENHISLVFQKLAKVTNDCVPALMTKKHLGIHKSASVRTDKILV